jgi:RNA polymerase sigma-70 factor (ECF subfamily)
MDVSENHNQNAGFGEHIADLYPQLFRLAMRLCRDRANAHDLAQDAVERALRNRELFRSGERPDRWMFTILRRIFVDDCRARRRRPRVPLLEEHDAVVASEPEPPCAWEDFTTEDVKRALLFVDRPGREVFAMFTFQQLAQKEIARRLSIPQKTVATRMFRVRGKLRELLGSGAYRRQLVLLPPPAEPMSPAPAPAPGMPHPPRTRIAAARRRARVSAAGAG